MGFIWFWIVAVMIAAYVVLDGFDIGIGILYPFLARNEEDRCVMMRAIGPVWDGNEVWLLAGGGTLYFAFPLLYASAFSGFYLPLMIVLWLLIGRGASIELRLHVDNAVWRSFFDGLFFLSSALLAIFLGAALANVVRGVPLGADQYFFLPLWTNWRVGPHPGILDWYTVIGGLVAFIALATHGALYLATKAPGDLDRALRHNSRKSPGNRPRAPGDPEQLHPLPSALCHPRRGGHVAGWDQDILSPKAAHEGFSRELSLSHHHARWGVRSTLPHRASIVRQRRQRHHHR